jgi:hypothetical protein
MSSPVKRVEAFAHSRLSCKAQGQEGFSEVTGGRALSFHDLSMGETAAPSHSTLLMALSKVEGLVEGNAEGAELPRG